MMKTVWTDLDGDEIELAELDGNGNQLFDFLWLSSSKCKNADAVYLFDVDDAESFAAVLLAWAKRQREGER